MPINIKEFYNALSAKDRAEVDKMAARYVEEEMTLRELRKARRMTQKKIAKSLKTGQEGVSRLEKRSDLLVSTLRSTVAAMGGDLSLVATFPDRAPVVITQIGDL